MLAHSRGTFPRRSLDDAYQEMLFVQAACVMNMTCHDYNIHNVNRWYNSDLSQFVSSEVVRGRQQVRQHCRPKHYPHCRYVSHREEDIPALLSWLLLGWKIVRR